jgi:hypothetical protein
MRSRLDRTRARKKEHPEVEPSCGNVFADLGFPNPDEALLKAPLAGQIIQLVHQRKPTRARAAESSSPSPARAPVPANGVQRPPRNR